MLTILLSLLLVMNQGMAAPLSPGPDAEDVCAMACPCGGAPCCVAPGSTGQAPASPVRILTHTEWQFVASALIRVLDARILDPTPILSVVDSDLHKGAVPIFQRNCAFLI